MADHSIRVVTLLTGDEYIAMQAMADSDGLSDSAFMRRLLKLEAQKRALVLVSDRNRSGDSTEPAHVRHSVFHGDR